ncbi:MAG: FecR domain-containing protein, partial [Lachnospiraceae bacterium]|nr:FecR domain-containing protein [Lachnospiraceae bacterium]
MNAKRKGLLQKVLMLVLVLCLVCGNGLMALANEAVASSMRLTKTEGTVSVTNKNGRDMGTMADMKLFNGYHLSTAQKSYAWMNLDDHKLVKMDAVSEAEIQKKGKDLEILLNSGNLLFNVSEHLKADETLNVRTSTMVTGIRGTCGWVKVIDSSRTQVYILEGQVECYVMDLVTGQQKSIVLRSGETAEFVVYDQTRVGD